MTDEEWRQILGLISPAVSLVGGSVPGLAGMVGQAGDGGFGGMGAAALVNGNAGVMPNAGMPATPGPMSLGPTVSGVLPPLPMTPGGPAGPVPDPVNPGAAGINPGPGWLQRNIGDPISQMWQGKVKLDPFGNPQLGPDGKPIPDTSGDLTARQKALLGGAGMAGAGLTKAAASPAAPPVAAGGGAYRPTPLDATRIAQARLQQLAQLRQQATLAAPWLQRYRQQPGLMG